MIPFEFIMCAARLPVGAIRWSCPQFIGQASENNYRMSTSAFANFMACHRQLGLRGSTYDLDMGLTLLLGALGETPHLPA